MKQSFKILLISACLFDLGYCQSNPMIKTFRANYDEQQWNIDLAPYGGFSSYPNSGLSAFSTFGANEPMDGYPGHPGQIKGISDTVAVWVRIQNHEASDFSIGSNQLQTWFMPVLYNPMLNPVEFLPFADSTLIKYSFKGWVDGHYWSISAPSSLPNKGGAQVYSLLYYVWNLPLGKTRLLMTKTVNMPTGVQLLIDYVRPVWVVEPKSLADTLNAFAACSDRAYARRDFTFALAWCDSMLLRHQTCVPAFMMKAGINSYYQRNDSLSEKIALDSTLAILNRYGDSVLGDTADWTDQTWQWYRVKLESVTIQHWKSVHGLRSSRGN